MTDQRDKPTIEPSNESGSTPDSPRSGQISRRTLIRGASVGLPTILTLNSGAAFAWAVGSGTVGTRPASSTATGDSICVVGDPKSGAAPGVYGVAESDLYRIRGDLYYKTGTGNSGSLLSPEQVCEYTGDVYYKTTANGTGTKVTKAWRGAVASLTHSGSMDSLSTNGIYTDTWPL